MLWACPARIFLGEDTYSLPRSKAGVAEMMLLPPTPPLPPLPPGCSCSALPIVQALRTHPCRPDYTQKSQMARWLAHQLDWGVVSTTSRRGQGSRSAACAVAAGRPALHQQCVRPDCTQPSRTAAQL